MPLPAQCQQPSFPAGVIMTPFPWDNNTRLQISGSIVFKETGKEDPGTATSR